MADLKKCMEAEGMSSKIILDVLCQLRAEGVVYQASDGRWRICENMEIVQVDETGVTLREHGVH